MLQFYVSSLNSEEASNTPNMPSSLGFQIRPSLAVKDRGSAPGHAVADLPTQVCSSEALSAPLLCLYLRNQACGASGYFFASWRLAASACDRGLLVRLRCTSHFPECLDRTSD